MKTYPNTGKIISKLVAEVLREPSPLSAGERELIAAYISSQNECAFCTGAHSVSAGEFLDDKTLVEQARPIQKRLR